MESKVKILIITIFLFCIKGAVLAQPDTLVVYEEVIVYDTVYVYDTIYVKERYDIPSLINPQPIKALRSSKNKYPEKLLLIFGEQAATFRFDSIIQNENNNEIKGMKKLGFFGVVYFAFQSMVLAQTSYEISIGSGAWWASGELAYAERPYSPLLSAGVFAKKNFSDRAIGLRAGLEYSYLISTGSYKYDGTIGVAHSLSGSEFERINEYYGAGLHNVTIPFVVYYDKHAIQPFVGVNYNYISTGLFSSSSFDGLEYVDSSHNFGLNIGTGIKLGNVIKLNVEYRCNLTSDYGEGKGNPSGYYVLGQSFRLRNSQAKISIVYTI